MANLITVWLFMLSGSVAQETAVMRIRRGDFYINTSANPWLINLNLIDVDRRVFIYIYSLRPR